MKPWLTSFSSSPLFPAHGPRAWVTRTHWQIQATVVLTVMTPLVLTGLCADSIDLKVESQVVAAGELGQGCGRKGIQRPSLCSYRVHLGLWRGRVGRGASQGLQGVPTPAPTPGQAFSTFSTVTMRFALCEIFTRAGLQMCPLEPVHGQSGNWKGAQVLISWKIKCKGVFYSSCLKRISLSFDVSWRSTNLTCFLFNPTQN